MTSADHKERAMPSVTNTHPQPFATVDGTQPSSSPDRPHPAGSLGRPDVLLAIDERVIAALRRNAPTVMRWSLGLVFVWFGALKVANVTPVAQLVADTMAFMPIPASVLVPALGVFEIVVGVALAVGRWLRPVLAAMVAHLSGTFLVLVLQPDVAFQDGNPLLLTTEGEFVIKNLVLIAGALLVAALLPPLRRSRS
jgi:putative oxidoreductase